MEKSILECIKHYQEQLEEGLIQRAYITLTQFMAELKSDFPNSFSTTNIGFGYLDYTYFYFFNDFLKSKHLKFALVLNHKKMQIELWLTGQTTSVREKYWQILKHTKWNQNRQKQPKYAVLEVCLENKIDFERKEEMKFEIFAQVRLVTDEILRYLENSIVLKD